MQLERDQDYRSGGMRGPHPHADRDTAKDSSSKFHGVGERKKQPDAVREVPGAKIEIPEPGILVPWVLCGHGGENAKKIQEYIQNQLAEDKLSNQMSMEEFIDLFTGEPVEGYKKKKKK